MIYLDWNATAPLRPEAAAAMAPWWGVPANPSSLHRLGQAAAAALDDARARIAAALDWDPRGVVFTSGATEANATVLSRGAWWVSAVEHPSVAAWGHAALPVSAAGLLDLDALDAALSGGARAVSVQAANHETGVVQPLAEIIGRCRRAGALLHVDAAQLPGRLPVAWDERPDFVTVSGHKVGGPVGIGALLVRDTVEPLLRGGRQERGRRAGTGNVASAVGFAAALEAVGAGARETGERRDTLEAALIAAGGDVLGAAAPRLPNTACLRFPGWDAADLVMALDLEGVAVSAGAACASGAALASPVLAAMGVKGGGVRFSLGPSTTAEDVAGAIDAARRVLARGRAG